MVGGETVFQRQPGLQLWSLPRNMGKGAAVREGMLLASGDFRLFMDADNQIHIEELDAFLPFKLTKNGLALQATIQGTKYWKDGDLN